MPAILPRGDLCCRFSGHDSGVNHPHGRSVRRDRDIPAPWGAIVTAQPDPCRIDPSCAAVLIAAVLIIGMPNEFPHDDGWFPAVRSVDHSPLRRPVEEINRLADACATVSPPSLKAAVPRLTEMPHGFTALSAGLTRAIHSQTSPQGDRP